MPSKPSLRQFDFVLIPFPFADLSAHKVRPAVIVSADPQGGEIIVAIITSVMTNHSARRAEVVLVKSDAEFAVSGLKADSLIRLDKLVTLSATLITRRLGHAGPGTKAKINDMLRRSFGL